MIVCLYVRLLGFSCRAYLISLAVTSSFLPGFCLNTQNTDLQLEEKICANSFFMQTLLIIKYHSKNRLLHSSITWLPICICVSTLLILCNDRFSSVFRDSTWFCEVPWEIRLGIFSNKCWHFSNTMIKQTAESLAVFFVGLSEFHVGSVRVQNRKITRAGVLLYWFTIERFQKAKYRV